MIASAISALGERLRSLVLTNASRETLACPFEPGGKLHGVGIPSPLYCKRCGQARAWHDVAAAARVVTPVPLHVDEDRRARLLETLRWRQN